MHRDLAAIAFPPPRKEDFEHHDSMADELYNDAYGEVVKRRDRLVRELAEDNEDGEAALLAEVSRARAEITEAERRLRLLLAYAREFQGRRPFPLRWLGDAAGMSHTHVRTVYGPDDIKRLAELLELPMPPGAHDETASG